MAFNIYERWALSPRELVVDLRGAWASDLFSEQPPLPTPGGSHVKLGRCDHRVSLLSLCDLPQ